LTKNLTTDLNERGLQVLEHCKSGYVPLKPLLSRMSKSSLYRHVDGLISRELLKKGEGNLYRTTPLGLEKLKEVETGVGRASQLLEERLPVLKYMPTEVHRALAFLTLSAVSARGNQLMDSHHPCFVAVGPTFSWKTWLAKALCYILGEDPDRVIILTPSETGRSVLTRKGYAGKTISKRTLLDSPFVCFDEFDNADEATKKMCFVYFQGRIRVPYENEELTIRPVSLITMNPRDSKRLSEAIGFSEPQMRRSIICDFGKVKIPEGFKSKGTKLLGRIERLPRLEIPSPLQEGAEQKNELEDILRACLKPDSLRLVDMEMMSMLARGASSFLSPPENLIQFLHCYFVVVETLDWTVEGWRSIFHERCQSLRRVELSSQDMCVLGINEEGSKPCSLNAEVRGILEEYKKPSQGSHDVFEMDRVRKEQDIGFEELLDFMKRRSFLMKNPDYSEASENLFRRMRSEGRNPEKWGTKAMSLIRKHGSYDRSLREKEKRDGDLTKAIEFKEEHLKSLDEETESLGTTRSHIRELNDLDKELKRYFRSKKRRSEGLKVISKAQKNGLTSDTLNAVSKEICGLQKAISESDSGLRSKLRKCTDLAEMTTRLSNEIEKKERDLGKLEASCASAKKLGDHHHGRYCQATHEMQSLKDESDGLKRERSRLLEEIGTLTTCKGEIHSIQQKLIGLKNQRDAMHEEIRGLSSYIWMTRWAMNIQDFLFDGKTLNEDGPFFEDLETLVEIKKGNRPYLKTFESRIERRIREKLEKMLSRVSVA